MIFPATKQPGLLSVTYEALYFPGLGLCKATLSVWDEESPLLMPTSRKTRQGTKRRAPQSCLLWAELGESAALRAFTYSLNRHQAFVWINLFRESCCVAQASLDLAGLPPQPL